MMASEQQQIFTTVSHPPTYQGTLRNTYGVNNFKYKRIEKSLKFLFESFGGSQHLMNMKSSLFLESDPGDCTLVRENVMTQVLQMFN